MKKSKGMKSTQWNLYQETLRVQGVIHPECDQQYSVEKTFDEILERSHSVGDLLTATMRLH